jgi:hypothetical protein
MTPHPFLAALKHRFPDVVVEVSGETGNAQLPVAEHGRGRLTARIRWEPATIEIAVGDGLPGGPCEALFVFKPAQGDAAAREALELVEDLLDERVVVVVRHGTEPPRLGRTAAMSAEKDFAGTIYSWLGTYDTDGDPQALPSPLSAVEIAYPALVFSTDGTITVADSAGFFAQGSTRAVRAGWFDGLVAVDRDGHRWRVVQVEIRRSRSLVGRLGGRLRNVSIELDCRFEASGSSTLEALQHRLVDATRADAEFWEAGWGNITALEAAITQAGSFDDLVPLFH